MKRIKKLLCVSAAVVLIVTSGCLTSYFIGQKNGRRIAVDFSVKELEKENAELKEELKKWKDEWQEQVQKATDEGYARTMQTIQLTKAKELIKTLLLIADNKVSQMEFQLCISDAKQFLKDSEGK